MKIIKYRVRKYRNIWDSGDIEVDNQITCFVGQNESGKTALLEALYSTNPASNDNPFNDTHTAFNSDNDYPKREVSKYYGDIDSGEQNKTAVVECECEIDDGDLEKVCKEFGSNALTGKLFTVKAFYNRPHEFEANDIEVDDQAAREHIAKNQELPRELKDKLMEAKDWNKFCDAFINTEQHGVFSNLFEVISHIQQQGILQYILRNVVWSSTKFLYCNDYYQIRGAENLDKLLRRKIDNKMEKSDYLFLELMEIVELHLDKMIGSQDTTNFRNRFKMPLKKAGEIATEVINRSWSQNRHLQVTFDVRKAEQNDPKGMQTGTNMWIDVYDNKGSDVPTLLSSRSSGLLWFFSFLVRYEYAKRRQNKEKLILLLDEPGLSLHGKAQGDLLKYFESNFSTTQIIYTTHSPFMIDPQNPQRVRTVLDLNSDDAQLIKEKTNERCGTRVFTNATKVDKLSWLPLQRALGYEIQQTFLISPNSLIVEGISDRLILQVISTKLKNENRTGLSDEWSIVHVGGIGNVRALVTLLAAQKNMNVVALLDIQGKDEQVIKKLYEDRLLEENHLLTYAKFANIKDADIEDMLGHDFYINLFNSAFGENLPKKINIKDLSKKSSTTRIVSLINGWLKKNSLSTENFGHYVPAQYLVRNIGEMWENVAPETKDNFEKLFDCLNGLLA